MIVSIQETNDLLVGITDTGRVLETELAGFDYVNAFEKAVLKLEKMAETGGTHGTGD